ncbi:MAG: type II toxin-antitoxin system prevent-host-death family antitoxin [Chitinivibrionales bacterium]|nr:type II toxin-antitoxin system prevent-host-death family antitoxin [Chitinivibrionales bacterium]
MKLSESVKPISHVKAHMSEIVERIGRNHKKVIITHNGEARAVLQDIESYEQLQDSLSMLKLVAMSTKSMLQNKGQPVDKAFADIRKRVKEFSAG